MTNAPTRYWAIWHIDAVVGEGTWRFMIMDV